MKKFRINAKRTPKPSGKKKPSDADLEEEPELEPEATEPEVEEAKGPAKSQANPYAKKQDSKSKPEFNTSFSSSNIDAVAYDPDKKQMWVRFKGQDVYTYYDVPLKIYRGFWSAPSKGHYFWEKIRKNKRIKYQKLTASLRWIRLSDLVSLNSGRVNIANLAKSLKRQVQRSYPEWGVSSNVESVFNGKKLDFDKFTVELVGYGNWVRVNVQDKDTGKIIYNKHDSDNPQDIINLVIRTIKKRYGTGREYAQLNAANTTTIQHNTAKAATTQLLQYLDEAIPEENWESSLPTIHNGNREYVIRGEHYVLTITDLGDSELKLTLADNWTQDTDTYTWVDDEFIEQAFTEILRVILQG